MKIKHLRQDRDNFPKCSAKLSVITRQFWGGRGRPANREGKDTCDCYASVKLGSKYFCRKHGGLYLLDNFTEFNK